MAIFLNTSPVSAKSQSSKVVVVGGGLAGLTVAYRLQQNNMEVHLFEARNRVGGRVLTAKIGNEVVELGGQSITDGGSAENMLGLIKELDLKLNEEQVALDQSYFTGDELISIQSLLNGKNYHPDHLRVQLDDLAKRCKNMREILDEILDENDPLYKMLAVRLAGYEGSALNNLSPLYAVTLYHMLLGGISAAHQGNAEEGNQLDLLSIKGGNALLSEKLAQTLGTNLHLNKTLIKISKNINHSFVLTFQDGQVVTADILVLAIPCSVYEDIVIEENVIPLNRLQSIRNVQYGTNAKILVPFSKEPLKKLGFINDRMGCFFPMSRTILTLYYTGSASHFSKKTIFDTYQQDRPMIEAGFVDECPPLIHPIYAKDEAFAVYDGPVGYSWPNDPFVKGSYSNIAPGQEELLTSLQNEGGELVKTLFAPIGQKLYFAGEHSSILMEVPGTMEAACESGERAARMILNQPDED